jgi:membrane protease subunit (stomatin/prohibitin family)
MRMVGDMNKYTQFQVAQSIPIAAANESGGIAGLGAGLGAGVLMAQTMAGALRPAAEAVPPPPPAGGGAPVAPTGGAPAAPAGETKFCGECGKQIPRKSKFCPECGTAQ